jgi:hypothetical protein
LVEARQIAGQRDDRSDLQRAVDRGDAADAVDDRGRERSGE